MYSNYVRLMYWLQVVIYNQPTNNKSQFFSAISCVFRELQLYLHVAHNWILKCGRKTQNRNENLTKRKHTKSTQMYKQEHWLCACMRSANIAHISFEYGGLIDPKKIFEVYSELLFFSNTNRTKTKKWTNKKKFNKETMCTRCSASDSEKEIRGWLLLVAVWYWIGNTFVEAATATAVAAAWAQAIRLQMYKTHTHSHSTPIP